MTTPRDTNEPAIVASLLHAGHDVRTEPDHNSCSRCAGSRFMETGGPCAVCSGTGLGSQWTPRTTPHPDWPWRSRHRACRHAPLPVSRWASGIGAVASNVLEPPDDNGGPTDHMFETVRYPLLRSIDADLLGLSPRDGSITAHMDLLRRYDAPRLTSWLTDHQHTKLTFPEFTKRFAEQVQGFAHAPIIDTIREWADIAHPHSTTGDALDAYAARIGGPNRTTSVPTDEDDV